MVIAKLTGIVDATGDGWAVVDVGGVGYLVSCSGRTLSNLVPGEATVVFVETQVREDAIQLFGFAEAAERDWFRTLTTVQGVGGKAALAILSVLSADELVHAVAAADRAAITRAAGVGPKLAARIIAELKDKVGAIALTPAATGEAAGVGLGGEAGDAVSALVNLGFRPAEALGAVSHAAGRLGAGADVEALIRSGLAELTAAEHAR